MISSSIQQFVEENLALFVAPGYQFKRNNGHLQHDTTGLPPQFLFDENGEISDFKAKQDGEIYNTSKTQSRTQAVFDEGDLFHQLFV